MTESRTKLAEAVPVRSSQPWLHQRGKEMQALGTVRQFLIALSYETRMYAHQRLNQLLADMQILSVLYRKHHGLMRGPSCSQASAGRRRASHACFDNAFVSLRGLRGVSTEEASGRGERAGAVGRRCQANQATATGQGRQRCDRRPP